MALLLLILLSSTLIFVFYYELVWKKFERERGKGLLGMAADLAFKDNLAPVPVAITADKKISTQNPWEDWKYRLMVELHRRGQIKPEEGAQIVGVSVSEIEKYLDKLEERGKIRSAGDSERGIFYRIVEEV